MNDSFGQHKLTAVEHWLTAIALLMAGIIM